MAFLKPLGTIITVGGLVLMGSVASAKDTYKVALDGTPVSNNKIILLK